MAKIKLKLNPDQLKEWALDAVRDADLLEHLPGEAKRRHAIRFVKGKLDDLLTFGSGPVGQVAEVVSDAAIEVIVGPVVEWAYQKIRGLLDPADA